MRVFKSPVAFLLTVACCLPAAPAGSIAPDEPTDDGLEGQLPVLDETQGRIEATLLARSVVGLRVGAVVVFQREVEGVAELWQGRLGRGPDGFAFLSGTISSGSAVAPFFAVEVPGLAAPQPTPSTIGDEGTPAPTPEPVSAPVVPLVAGVGGRIQERHRVEFGGG